jgi:biotin carboxyl carrier protein
VSVFAKGVIAAVAVIGALFGMVYLLLAMVLGPKLAYWVEGAVTFGVLTIMSVIWFGTALGPTGPDTAWQAIAMGPGLTQASVTGTVYNVADYPNGWQKPAVGQHLADLKGADDTASEALQAKPVMDAFVGDAVSTIPGLRNSVAPLVHGSVDLVPGQFTNSDIRIKPATVEGKPSLIAVAKAVPSEDVTATLPAGVKQANVVKYLVNVDDHVSKGQDVLSISSDNGPGTVTSPDDGVLIVESLRPGDIVRPGGPFATLDISSHPGQPQPVVVVAIRVRGKLRTPALYYFLASLALLLLHLLGLSRVDRARRAAAAPPPSDVGSRVPVGTRT